MAGYTRRIKDSEIHNHSIGKDIQNYLVQLILSEVEKQISSNLKTAKYYSNISNCTRDISGV